MTARIDLSERCVDLEAHVALAAVPEELGQPDLRVRFADGYAYARPPEPLLEPIADAMGEEYYLLASVPGRSGATVVFEREDPHGFLLPAESVAELAGELLLRWRVPLTHREHPAVLEASDAYEFPYLEDDHGLLVAGTLFPLVVLGDEPLLTAVRIEAPAGWSVLAPWPQGRGGSRSSGEIRADENLGSPWLRPSIDGLRNDMIAIGAWETRRTRIGDFEATIAVAPRQEGLMEVVGRSIGRIVEHQLELFGRSPRERYLFLFGRPDLQGFGGSTKDGSMILAVGGNSIANADLYVPHLVSHEFFHVWAASTTALPNELRWVNEGITDYYSYLVLARTGLETFESFAQTLGEKIGDYVASPLFAETSLEEAGGMRFFTEVEAHDYVYQGGLAIGAWLDRMLRTRYGSSLDLVLRDLLNDPGLLSGELEDPDRERFFKLVARHGDQALADELAILVGESLELDPTLLFEGVGVGVRDLGAGSRPRYQVDVEPWREHVLPE